MLKVSREDVSCDQIQQFPKETRFLKLPVERYVEEVKARKIIDGELNKPQIALINAINNPQYRFVVAAFSRRVGKTTVANMIAQLVCLVPESNVLIMSPNYSLSSISFELQRNYIKKFELEVIKDNTKDRILELSNGSTIRMGSVSQVDSCVGRSYNLVLFDESALSAAGEDAFNIALRPTLDRENSKAIFISTPRGKMNWFSRFWDRGFLPEYPQWVSLHADWRENPRAVEVDIKEAQLSMSRAEFEQEYEASFSSFVGQIFDFDHNCVQSLAEFEHHNCEVIMGLDIGFKDATAGIVLATDGDKFYALEEYYATERTTDQHAEEIKRLEELYDIQYIFIDSAAQQTRHDWAVNHDITTINANKSKLDGIAFVQSLVEQNRLIVDPKCKELIASLDQYRWSEKENLQKETPVHDRYSHMADALRYALYSYGVNVGGIS